jgi:hypothetical protein
MDNNLIKTILIKQPAGLGDIFFCQKIAYALYDKYKCNIIWPVIPEFIWIKEYIQVPFIQFVDIESNFLFKEAFDNINDVSYIFSLQDCLIIPLQRADWTIPGSVMEAKYKLIGLEFDDWVNYFTIKRNLERENNLYFNILGLKEDEEYVFVNKNFASPPNTKKITNINYPDNKKIIEMQFIPGDNIFDWLKVIENASEIYTVETSICYFIEKLNCKSKQINLYSRDKKPNFDYIKNIFNKNYIYYEGRCI